MLPSVQPVMRRRPNSRPADEGMALVLVLIVLVLTSILALEIKRAAALHSRLAVNKRDDFLLQHAMQGQLVILREVLHYDRQENQVEKLDDRWADEKYTRFQKGPTEEEREELLEEREEPVSSEEYEITATVTDENRKFNLHCLEIEDDAERKVWEDVFLRLLVVYREDFPRYALSRSDAENLLANLREWIRRRDDDRGVPRPATIVDGEVLVTPDELLMVEGFTREMFYDLEPPEEDDEVIPGLYRYLTLWSDRKINVNTAELPVLRALFRETDDDLAHRLLEWRDMEAEEQPQDAGLDDDPVMNHAESTGDLAQIDGFDQEAIQRNNLAATTIFAGNHFSITLIGEGTAGFRRQERYIVERNAEGSVVILAEERNDPQPELDRDDEEE